ncbi:hypothetical protein EAV90_17595 [Bradyrhizobium vignae]|nr:hypothetical protein EAV90_17595 [Bradyrhizobium vignae]
MAAIGSPWLSRDEMRYDCATTEVRSLQLAGEDWGEGASAMGQSPRGESPHPVLRHSRGFASACLR